jgi:hypothetical protein
MANKKKELPSIGLSLENGKIEICGEMRSKVSITIEPTSDQIRLLDELVMSNELVELKHIVEKCSEFGIITAPILKSYELDFGSPSIRWVEKPLKMIP